MNDERKEIKKNFENIKTIISKSVRHERQTDRQTARQPDKRVNKQLESSTDQTKNTPKGQQTGKRRRKTDPEKKEGQGTLGQRSRRGGQAC